MEADDGEALVTMRQARTPLSLSPSSLPPTPMRVTRFGERLFFECTNFSEPIDEQTLSRLGMTRHRRRLRPTERARDGAQAAAEGGSLPQITQRLAACASGLAAARHDVRELVAQAEAARARSERRSAASTYRRAVSRAEVRGLMLPILPEMRAAASRRAESEAARKDEARRQRLQQLGLPDDAEQERQRLADEQRRREEALAAPDRRLLRGGIAVDKVLQLMRVAPLVGEQQQSQQQQQPTEGAGRGSRGLIDATIEEKEDESESDALLRPETSEGKE
jgi:hypothetical protein